MCLGTAGSANNQLTNPGFLARDSNSGTLYMSSGVDRIMCWQPNATTGTVVAGGNGRGTTTSQLYEPLGVYFDSLSNSLYIGNYGAHNIVSWPLGATNWTLIAGSTSGTCGSTSTMLCYPTAMTLDSMGNLYVADTNNNRIQLFLAGSSNGITIASANFPGGVALDSQLNLYVTEQYNHRVLKFMRL
ncbi:unnamed protein product [Rotaria sp. Silwood2]|nr:unnamed protein product [Rotaria sp. Silwood2]CAF3398761.1 unnamed protein product [Rotaria sp. Silwood2]CAF4072997.1 unnamed protein product [Rotaria sp. Silwood2]CAF4416484.1 unnamed protein product [Rotaria sp. Silwood2]CAF4437878.1 unnamed protein product [Rotaria sp. Silwood2]